MSNLKGNRRELVVAAAVVAAGGLLPNRGVAQTGNAVGFSLTKFTAAVAGSEHTGRLKEIQIALGGKPILSIEGLSQSVNALLESKLISPQGAALLKKLVKEILAAVTIESLARATTEALKALNDKVDEVTQAIVRIAQDSLQSAKDIIRSIDIKMAIFVVCSDISGALTGAATGGQLGGPAGALVGSVIGAVSGSAIAVFSPR